jgi:hypothetical protein
MQQHTILRRTIIRSVEPSLLVYRGTLVSEAVTALAFTSCVTLIILSSLMGVQPLFH